MKNINYDLNKLLHTKLDTIWRLENFYINDAQKAKCHSIAALKKILADEKQHLKMLSKELGLRMDAGVFN